MKKKILSLLLALTVAVSPALALEGVPAQVDDWAKDSMLECMSLGLWQDEYLDVLGEPITQTQMDDVTAAMADKLVLLDLPQAEPSAQAILTDNTRQGVINAFYQEVSAYILEGVTGDPVETLQNLDVVRGDGAGLALDRICTLQEALTMAQRLLLRVYDQHDMGTKGLLWKATGHGNTLYLLGTYHVDRDNLYPVHATVRNALQGADTVITEVDFADEEDITRLAQLQTYGDGTTLADHISPELYQQAKAALVDGGILPQEAFDLCRPWALASVFTQLALMDETSNTSGMLPIDLYVQYKANTNNVPLVAAESATFQAEHVMNALSEEYQEAWLAASLYSYLDSSNGGGEGTSAEVELMSQVFSLWQRGDLTGFDAMFGKDQILASADEMNEKLFTERDPNMIAFADNFLKSETPITGFMAVGAGHMVGQTGIVQGLQDLGYTVEYLYP